MNVTKCDEDVGELHDGVGEGDADGDGATHLGPASKTQSLSSPISKWKSRAEDIASCNLAQAATAMLYNRSAVTVLGYHAQLILFDNSVLKHEPVIISRLTHAPHNMYGTDLAFQLAEIGCINFTSARCMNLAALF